jgi:mannan endo-1,4-beta-mannosidase
MLLNKFIKKVVKFSLVFCLLFSIIGSQKITFADTNLKIGAWTGTSPTSAVISNLQTLQQRKLDIVQMFINWSTSFNSIREYADAVYANGSILNITWEPWGYNTVRIKNGEVDSYIKNMADDMKAYGKEIWLRPLHEANGNWYPWSIGDSSINTNESYIAAYRHIVDIFRAEGATNVKWIFNINSANVGQGASFTGHYPGDNYVDYNSLDGYNWGTTQQSWGSKWQSFDEIFSASYNALKQYNKPIIISEIASAEIGGDKAQWITDTFKKIKTSYDKVFSVIWFNENKETNWLINSSTASLDAYIKAIAPSNGKIGDLSNDGVVNSIDLSILKKYLLGLSPNVTPNSYTWDINNDGQINSIDLAFLKRLILKS